MSDYIELTIRAMERLTIPWTIKALSIEGFYKDPIEGYTRLRTKSGDERWVDESPQEILAKIEKWKKGIDPETMQREDQRIRNKVVSTIQSMSVTHGGGASQELSPYSCPKCGIFLKCYCNFPEI